MKPSDEHSAQIERLKSEIRSAFAHRRCPGDNRIVSGDSQEYGDIRRSFCGRDWRDLYFEKLEYHHDDMPFFTTEAYCLCLPACLT